MIRKIDYYELFDTKLCKEVMLHSSGGTGGGSMTSPSEVVIDSEKYLKRNLDFIDQKGIVLSDKIREFYEQVAGIRIEYGPNIKFFDTPITLLPEDVEMFPDAVVNTAESICRRNPSLRGYINIPQLEALINGPDGKKWEGILWFDHMEDESREMWQQYLLFDYSVSECGVMLKLENNRIEDNLYFYYMDNEEPIDLGIGIEKYLMMAYKVKAFNGWQYALAKHPSDNGLSLKRMKHYLPQMFPKLEFDFSDFEEY